MIKLYEEGKTYKEIAKIVRISPRDIGKIINEYLREKTAIYTKSNTAKAYDLLLKGKSPIQVAIILDIKFEDIMRIYSEYLRLQGMRSVETIYKNHKDHIPLILQVINLLRFGEITVQEFNQFCKYVRDIPALQRIEAELQHKVNILSIKTNSL